MPGVLGHGAEGVCTAGCKGVHAAGTHVHEQRPGVAVIQDVRHTQGAHKPPHEEPEGQQVRPDVEGLIGHLEKTEDTGGGGTLWMSVAEENALLMEHLGHLFYAEQPGQLQAQHLEAGLGRLEGNNGCQSPGLTQSSAMALGASGQWVSKLLLSQMLHLLTASHWH